MENTQKPFLSHTEKFFFFFFSSSSSSPSPPFWVLLYSPEMVWCISGVSEDSRNALNATVATLSGQCAVWIGRGERERESHKELANRKFVGLPAMRAPRTMQVAQFTVAALASCGREPLAVSLSPCLFRIDLSSRYNTVGFDSQDSVTGRCWRNR